MDLCQATAEDAPFIYGVYESTARHLVEGIGKRWAERPMRNKSDAESVDGQTQIILLHGERIGFYSAEHRAAELWLESLFILPEYQGKGIGKFLLLQALGQARSAGVPLRCQVMAYNPAGGFYKHHGMIVVREEGDCVYLESAA